MKRIVRRVAPDVLRWSIVCWVIVFWRIGYVGLIDDGAHYASLTREMLRHESWMVPLLDGVPYIDKPVLFHWLQGLAIQSLGETEAAARLPSALAAIALFGLTKWVGVKLFGPGVGTRGWLMLATIPATFVLGRVGYLDMLFTALTFGSVACLLVAAERGPMRLQHAGYALLALAVMTKGPIAIALVGMALAFGWMAGGEARRAVASLSCEAGCLAAVIVASPWFIWMYWRFGQEFVRGYVLSGHLAYLAPRSSGSSFAHTFYVQMFFAAFFPWSLVTSGYAIDTLRRRRSAISPPAGETLLWAWIATVLVVFTLARFRVDRYIYPAAPACCLLAANGWMAAKNAKKSREYFATKISILALAVILAGLGIALAVNLPGLELHVPPAAFILPMALALGGIVVVVIMVRHGLKPPAVMRIPVTTMLVAYATIVALGLPAIEQGRPIKQVGRWLQSQSMQDDFVGLYGLDRWEPSLRYYASRRLRRIASENDARVFLSSPGRGWLVMRKQEHDALLASGDTGPIAYSVSAVVGTTGKGIRRQVWSEVVVVRK